MHSYYLYLLDDLLTEKSVDRNLVLANTGLESLRIPTSHVLDAAQLDCLFLNALTVTDDPHLGVKLGAKINRVPPGVLGDALMSSANIGQALTTIARYLQAVLPSLNIELEETQSKISLVSVAQSNLTKVLYQFYTEVLFGAIVTSGRVLIGGGNVDLNDHSLAHLEFSYCTMDDEIYRQVFGSSINFEADRSALSFMRESLSIPISTANHLAQELFRRECDRLYAHQEVAFSVSEQVKHHLCVNRARFPSCAEIAAKLNMSESTLRRKLAKENQGFQTIVDKVRHRLAVEYLTTTKIPVSEIAALLGFSDSANFRRAFKRWNGSTPSFARRQTTVDTTAE